MKARNLLTAGLVWLVLWTEQAIVRAQTQATCVNGAQFQWTFNSLGQSPCDVASALGSVCTGKAFIVIPLESGQVYAGPTIEDANSCRCSTVFYSLLSACAICQIRTTLLWSIYDTNCTTAYTGVFKMPLPPGAKVPHWAYNDVTVTNNFNATAAQITSDQPESSFIPSPTSSGSSSSHTASSSGSSSHAGAIAGGVIGGLIGLALLAGLLFLLIRRRRRHHHRHRPEAIISPTSATPFKPDDFRADDQTPMSFNTMAPSPPFKLYNPSDPTTFPPTSPSDGYTDQRTMQSSFVGSQPSIVPGGSFRGNPEV